MLISWEQRCIIVDLKNIWDSSLEKFKENLSSIVYETWFSETELFDLNNNTAKIKVPTHVHKKYLKGMNVYYSIIPEKNYYLENDDHLKLDYNKIQNIMQNELVGIEYIDIRS